MDIISNDKTYIANTYARFPLVIESGSGSVVYDADGKEYIDLGTGIAVNSFGVADPVWTNAVTQQLCKLPHTSNLYYSEPCVKLAEQLCLRTNMKRVFFSNSGAEANECAIKTARKYSAERYGDDRYNIITLQNSFHGRTITTLAATGQDVFHHDFLPLTQGFLYAEPTVESLSSVLAENSGHVAAIMFEVVLGEGGVIPLSRDFTDYMSKVAADEDILLIADEVQTGNGRTGALYGYMNYDITPDIFTTAKGLGGGLPIGATVFGEKTADTLRAGEHGSTFGGNPVVCAGALSILNRIDDGLLASVREKSRFIKDELTCAPGIAGVTGMGLMLGIETTRPASDVIADCMARGVLVIKAKSKVRLLPALNIPQDKLAAAIAVLKEVCAAE